MYVCGILFFSHNCHFRTFTKQKETRFPRPKPHNNSPPIETCTAQRANACTSVLPIRLNTACPHASLSCREPCCQPCQTSRTCVLSDLHHRGAEGAHEDAHACLAVVALHAPTEVFLCSGRIAIDIQVIGKPRGGNNRKAESVHGQAKRQAVSGLARVVRRRQRGRTRREHFGRPTGGKETNVCFSLVPKVF